MNASAESRPAADNAAKQTRNVGRIVAIVIAVSLLLYWLADRFTPYTSQARVDGYVVGVAPKVAGEVVKVSVINNQTVKAGQPLFEIDPSQYRIALAKARSDLESTRRQVGAGGSAVEAARANLVAARANERKATQDATRLRRLRQEDPGTISVRRVEIAEASLDQAHAQVTAAQADIQRAIDQMGGDDIEKNALLLAAIAAVDKAELDLSNTRVAASSEGVITDLRADVGHYAGTGSPVLTLIAVHDVWIDAEFTENNLGHMELGTPVDIVFDSLPGHVFKGKVRSIGVGVSASPGPDGKAGNLPSIQNDRDWLRQAQRFPVIIDFDTAQEDLVREQLRVGGQASVIAYGARSGPLAWLGKLYIRIASWLTYLY